MRKLFALILILGGMSANGQSITPVNGDYQYNGNVYFAKGLFIPVLDTVAGYLYRVGAERIRPADTVGHPLTVPVYVWTGRRWMNAVGSGGSSYTAGNGLSLSGSQFRLGGTLDATTAILTNTFGFNINAAQPNRNTLYLGPGTGGTTRIGYNNIDGTFGGYEYLPDFGRGKSRFFMKGLPVLSYDYTGLELSDTAGTPIANINTDGSLRLKQPNGNYYLDAGINKFLTMSTGDTVFYADDTRAQFRALANADPLKVLATDAFGAIKLVTSPSANTIYTSNGTIPDERTITGATSNGVSWNSFNAFNINEDDGAGSVASYGFFPYGFAWGWTPTGGEPTSEFNYNSNILSLSLATSTQYKATKTIDAQLGSENSAYEKQTGAITNNERIEFHQGFDSDSSIFTIRKYKTNWSGNPGKLFDIDSFGTVKMQKYRNNSGLDSVLSTNQFGKIQMKYIPPTENTIYTGDGTLTGSRQVHLDGHQLQIIDDGSSFGETNLNLNGGGNISMTAKAPSGDPNTNYPGVVNAAAYGTYIGSEGRTHLTHTDVDTISARLLFNKFSDVDAHAGYENKAGVDSVGFFVSHGFIDHPSTVNTTLLRVDSTGNTSTLKLSAPIINAYNTTGVPFTSYYNFSHDGVDTSKKTWSIGLQGTATAPIGNGGDSLKFRSYTTTGAVLSDLMTLTRTGQVYMPGNVTIGPVTNTLTRLTVNGGGTFSNGIYAKGSGIRNGGALQENATRTVTGDYTVVGASDLYINVNNSANCTITLSLPGVNSTYHIKKISNNAFTVTIVGPNGTELIDGSTSLVLTTYNEAKTLHEDTISYFTY